MNSIYLTDKCSDLLFLNFLDLPLQVLYAIILARIFSFKTPNIVQLVSMMEKYINLQCVMTLF